MTPPAAPGDEPRTGPALPAVPFPEAVRAFARIAAQSFGGPAGQIAVMHRVVVEEKRWIAEDRFLHALNFCMFLPGPEAQQLATYLGWLLHGRRGGLVAGALFVLPGFLAILALSVAYALWHGAGPVAAVFAGVKPAVLAVVVEALLRISRRALKTRAAWLTAGAAFVALFAFAVPFPVVVAGAAALGALRARAIPPTPPTPSPDDPVDAAGVARRGHGHLAGLGSLVRTIVFGAAIWFAPLALLAAALGGAHVLVVAGVFFAKTAVVTFGGAYAVLAYIGQRAVETYGWLAPGEMLDGLGLAETTPGPLIMVVQFVAFLGAHRAPAPFDPIVAGVLGSLVTVWVTFVPCFLWIFAFAPYVERLRESRRLASALTSITAAVVGVILNLAVWFGVHTLFRTVHEREAGPLHLVLPDPTTLDPLGGAIAMIAAVALLRFHVPLHRVLIAAAAAGLLLA